MMLFKNMRASLAACTALIALFVVLSLEVDGHALRETKEQAIKQHLDDESRHLMKRQAERDSKKDEPEAKKSKRAGKPKRKGGDPPAGSTTTSTTPPPSTPKSPSTPKPGSPATTSTTSMKPAGGAAKSKKGSSKPTATADTTTHSPKSTKKPSDDDDKDKDKEKDKDKDKEDEHSSDDDSTKSNKRIADPTSSLIKRLQQEEEEALNVAIAGLNAWLRSLEKIERSYNILTAGRYLTLVKKMLQLPYIRMEGKRLMDSWHQTGGGRDFGNYEEIEDFF